MSCSTVTVTKCQAALRTLQAFPFFRPTCLCKEPGVDPECNYFRDFLFDHPCGFVQKKGNPTMFHTIICKILIYKHPLGYIERVEKVEVFRLLTNKCEKYVHNFINNIHSSTAYFLPSSNVLFCHYINL